MKKGSSEILRVGLAVTFLWVGILIVKHPEAWGNFLMPWAAGLLPVPLREAMIATAALDIAIGLLLLLDVWTWVAALFAVLHLAVVLAVSGIDEVTVRDLGLLAASVAVLADRLPDSIVAKSPFRKR